jgi:hypothetical protein
MGVLGTVGHVRGGGVCERGKGARGHPGTWESHLALRKMPGKGRYRLTNDPACDGCAARCGNPSETETQTNGASAVRTREGNEAWPNAQGQS